MEPALRRFTALGTIAVVGVTDPAALPEALSSVDEEIMACDLACSRFRADSELSRLNAANGRAVDLSPTMADYLTVALGAAQVSDGLVDPTVGRALVALGYDRDFPLVVAAHRDRCAPVLTFLPAPGWRAIHMDTRRRRANVEAGVQLDLGATAKAHCADRAAAAAADASGCGVLVSLGGDVAAVGTPPDGGWRIKVTEDSSADPSTAPGPTVAIASGGLATSGVTLRSWKRGGVDLHHIIDPKNGAPAAVVWKTVSTAAPSCLDANVASTAAMVLGAGAADWLADRGIPARLVAADGSVLTIAGWPADQAMADRANAERPTATRPNATRPTARRLVAGAGS
jgi:thiamine biosynthesis lipoprotein